MTTHAISGKRPEIQLLFAMLKLTVAADNGHDDERLYALLRGVLVKYSEQNQLGMYEMLTRTLCIYAKENNLARIDVSQVNARTKRASSDDGDLIGAHNDVSTYDGSFWEPEEGDMFEDLQNVGDSYEGDDLGDGSAEEDSPCKRQFEVMGGASN